MLKQLCLKNEKSFIIRLKNIVFKVDCRTIYFVLIKVKFSIIHWGCLLSADNTCVSGSMGIYTREIYVNTNNTKKEYIYIFYVYTLNIYTILKICDLFQC